MSFQTRNSFLVWTNPLIFDFWAVNEELKFSTVPHQSSTAEEDHEDDEGLKPAVLHYLIARLPQPPPRLTQTSRRVDITTLTALHTDWRDRD